MSRYIDADALDWSSIETQYGARTPSVVACEILIDSVPSIDIVRCGDCRWYNCKACFRDDGTHNHRNLDDYCSYGEREGE